MTSKELYVKDARVWITHSEHVWEGAILTKDYNPGDKILYVLSDSGLNKEFEIKNNELPHLRNPPILIGQNDLTALSYLHEPDVLYNLQVRFCDRQSIYTYCGIVLIAINPYDELPIYGADIINAYRGHSLGELEPHIFAIAEEAYAKLEREKCDLSIIVSGESGAGKTVSAKYVMRYFAAVGGSESETQIEKKVLASSPIMEAIGNAKTTRNDNSSRFGKFIKLLFKNEITTMALTGATMQTYLLEKSRVVFQAPNERNYHIFYQLCAARDQYPELMLDHQNSFRYLNQGNSPDIPRVSDLQEFQSTINALKVLGFKSDEINDIIQILAGILHLGNVKITHKKTKDKEIDMENCDVSLNDLHLNVLCDIFKIDVQDLRKWIITRKIESFNEDVLIPMNLDTAEAARDALSKHCYAKLFEYIVQLINKSLDSGKEQNCFIGVLDIYGFETFDINSFEQFCINYANEKLQQQFNQHVFKLEQEEYLKEGIVWTMIDFYDNQPCIDLIESKLGILDLLDEECRMPKGSDESWVGKLIEKCTKYNHFEKSRFGSASFIIKHFSDNVQYQAYGFLEKNRDTVSKELVNVFKESGLELCRKLMDFDGEEGKENKQRVKVVISASKQQPQTNKQHKKTVGSQFRENLTLLIQTLHATTPHYVRCIKPNEDKSAFAWDTPKIVQQLRACGVLETVRISAAGFPSRWEYEEFYNRYRLLCKKPQHVEDDFKLNSKNILTSWIKDEDKYRFGHTQIFFRAGQVAYLEQIRSDIRKKYIVVVQSVVRRFIYWKRFINLKKSILLIQSYSRGLLARRRAKHLKETKAAVTIQRYMRGWICRTKFLFLRFSISRIQTHARGLLARRKFKNVLDNYKATEIQRFCRGYLARKALKIKLRNIIICQSRIRGFLARKLYKRMKAEARTISHIQKKYSGLEKKVMILQQKIDEINKENGILRSKADEVDDLKQKLEAMKLLEQEVKHLRTLCNEKDQTIITLNKQIDNERDEKMALLEEKTKVEKEKEDQQNQWIKENEELKKHLKEMSEVYKKEEIAFSTRIRLLSDMDTNEMHQAYQKTVKDKENLENENIFLRHEIEKLSSTVKTNGHPAKDSLFIHTNDAFNEEDEDYGYSSAKNTLENRKPLKMEYSNDDSINSTWSSESKQQTALIIRMRKLLEDEKNRNIFLENQVKRLQSKSNLSMSAEDSLRISELEVENEKLRQDYQLLRDSIKRGVEQEEIEAQYHAIQEELKRRRDECIQLKTVLAQQSQSLRSLGSTNLKIDDKLHESGELLEAFQAQKLVNRQLESELTALTEENNAKLEDLNKQVDTLRSERDYFQNILLEKFDKNLDSNSIIDLKNKENFLRYELEKATASNADIWEKYDIAVKKLKELKHQNDILINKLKDHGVKDPMSAYEETKNMAAVKMKAKVYQGIFKYHRDDENKIWNRLVVELQPRIALTLLPGLPAYILFMCIRYTDLINAEDYVKSLLSNFVLHTKKMCKIPNTIEYRILWLVNSITLLNLLKQYGGIDEYIQLNTPSQNQQQLKNFDLSEYRQVIIECITLLHEALIRQVQDSIKSFIVNTILIHDEMAKSKTNRSKSLSLDTPNDPNKNSITDPETLVNVLERYFKQFQFFGLDELVIQQIFTQFMYYICAVAMNNLLLRPELCVWKTGMKIKYNVGCFESWISSKKMSEEVKKPLKRLIEVALLLQLRKTEDDVNSICENTQSLSAQQVLKIVKSYNSDDCELPIKPVLIEKLSKMLYGRVYENNDEYMMNEKNVLPLKLSYKSSDIKLEDIELPSILNMSNLLTKI